MAATYDNPITEDYFIHLYIANLVPLYVVLVGFTWVVHDYFVTLQEEIHYVWRQKPSFGRFMFFWIRYYTIFLLAFDVLQIHGFAIPGLATNTMCLVAAPVTRMAGAISLWSIEIIMQLRIYALFNQSKKIAAFNLALFMVSIGVFLWILVVNSIDRSERIASAKHLPLPGCPVINGGTEWALWIPPTVFEFILFVFVIIKGITSMSVRIKLSQRISLAAVLIQENTLYFFSPMHAALGIVTCRMLLHLRKFAVDSLGVDGLELATNPGDAENLGPLEFLQATADFDLSTRPTPRMEIDQTVQSTLSSASTTFEFVRSGTETSVERDRPQLSSIAR